MHFKNVLNFLGLWSYPFGLAAAVGISYFVKGLGMQTYTLGRGNIMGTAVSGLAVPALVMLSNLYDYLAKGKKDFAPDLSVGKNVTSISDSKKRAMYRKVRKEDGLLSKRPDGLIFGTQDKKYVSL